MKRTAILGAAGAVLLLAANGAWAADPLSAPKFGTWGFDLGGQDTSVKPGDDFFAYANGAWDRRTEIPADRSSYGNFHALRELSDARVRDIVEHAAAGSTADEKMIGAFYASFMDEARIKALGAKAIAPDLARVRAARDRSDVARLMGESTATLMSSMFPIYVEADAKHPDTWALYAIQGGLGLPDRDYYLDVKFAETKAKYRAYVADLLTKAGWPDAGKRADEVVALETRVAQAHWPAADTRDDVKAYNPMTFAELAKAAPGFDWPAYIAGAKLDPAGRLIVSQPSAYTGTAKVIGETPVETLKAWAAFHLIDNAAPYLSPEFETANFAFRNKELQGQPEQRARWKRGVALVNTTVPHAVGKLYAAKYFGPDAQAKMADLIVNMRAGMKARIERVSWMSPETKTRALEKLDKFSANIGAPPRYRDFSGLVVRSDDLVGNLRRSATFEWDYYRGQIGTKVDRQEWVDTPQTVNAWYRQTRNDITFPAGILQPPMFDPDADPAINYGGIGGTIGHEISHGFDDQGRNSDGDGVLRDWWTAEDTAKFTAQADVLGAQYETIAVIPNAHINGKLTMGENIADLAGLQMALEAYHRSLKGQEAPVIDGLTGDQRVFLGWAQAWRGKYRDGLMRQILVSDPHSPPMARVNGVVRNIDAWYAAFDVKPGDRLYVAPDKRVRLW